MRANRGRSRLRIDAFDRVRFDKDGKAIEHWGVEDDKGMVTQLGLAPEMG